jgi:ribosomal protein S18 acetylase RimI-like enzyme
VAVDMNMDSRVDPAPVIRATSIPGIGLRACRESDLAFLEKLFATTREAELRQLGDWADAQKAEFVRSQFQLQHDHYTQHYPGATLDVVLEGDLPIGRWYVHRGRNEIRLMEVTLLPEKRNRGIGSALTGELLAEAAGSGVPVVLHVEARNPARHLYERLGFSVSSDPGAAYQRLEWNPS